MNTEVHAAQLFVQCLEAEGVTHIFGVPGEENLAFLDALRTSSITLVTTRHEQGAVFMAAAFGRLTGKVGVALSTLGPGATNTVTGIAYAQLGGMPVLVITGQKPITKSKQGNFQILDIVRMMEPLTKYSATVRSADKIPMMVREAFKCATSERPGAVHLELPEDIAAVYTHATPIIQDKVRRPIPDEKAMTHARVALEHAEHPLVLVASGANRKRIRAQLQLFLEKTQIPFVTTQMGKGVEDERSALYMGTTALSSGDYVHKVIDQADVIVVIGHDINEKPPYLFDRGTQKIIHINFSQADIDDVYVPDIEVVGDISNALWQLTESITVSPSWNFEAMKTIHEKFEKTLELNRTRTSFPIIPEYLVSVVEDVLPDDGILSLDNGMYKIWFARNYHAREQNSVLLDNALATMGAGLPVGMATKLLYPDKKVLVVAGDGGFMMNIAELETAKRLGLDLVVLLLRDNGYGMISWKQHDMQLPAFGLEFSNPDFVKLAESFGVTGHRITQASDLSSILTEALNTKGVHIIDCPVDYSHNGDALGKDLKEEISRL